MPTTKPVPRVVRQETDRLDRLLTNINLPKTPKSGWVRVIRETLSMSQKQLARRMAITQQSVHKLESAEADGTITLARLQRAADELGCDVCYVLVPRHSFQESISNQAKQRAMKKLRRVQHTQALEASAGANDAMVNDLALEMVVTRPTDLWD